MIIDKNLRIELCTRSGYSEKIGVGSIKNIVKDAKTKKIGALCLADYYTTAGFYEFEAECNKNKIKAIFGSTVKINIKSHIYDLLLIAKNKNGICELNKMISELNYNPFDILKLETLPRNLITILIPDESVIDELEELKLFDYIGITNGETCMLTCMLKVIDISRIVEIDCAYTLRKQNTMLAESRSKKPLIKYRKLRSSNMAEHNYICSEPYFNKFVFDNPKALISLVDEVVLQDRTKLHKLDELMPYDKFEKEVFYNIKQLYHPVSKNVRDRAKEELLYLKNTGSWIVLTYIMNITKVIRDNNQNYILRRFGNSSLICYALGISNIDPIKYGLYFENLFNGDVTQPDIDISVSPNFIDFLIDSIGKNVGLDCLAYAGLTYFYDGKNDQNIIPLEIENNALEDTGLLPDFLELKPGDLINTCIYKNSHRHGLVFKSKFDTFFDSTALINKSNITIMDTEYTFLNKSFYKLDILENLFLDVINSTCEELCNYGIKSYDSEMVVNSFIENVLLGKETRFFKGGFIKDIIKKVKPKNIKDLVKIVAIEEDNRIWDYYQYKLFDKYHDLKKIITTVEDVIDCLVSYGMSLKEAYAVAENIRIGNGNVNKYQNLYNIPNEIIKTLNSFSYLFSRGYILEKVRCMLIASLTDETTIGV